MDKALNQLSVPLGQLREEVLVSAPHPNNIKVSMLQYCVLVCLFQEFL
jgi:hypothetical protein